jgi:hypothetical protein
LLVTEGPLKAETVKAFFPHYNVVANGGVSCSHREIITAGRYRRLEIAFDTDSLENPHVAGALARLLCLRIVDQETYEYGQEVRILFWDKIAKGLDEAFLRGLPIRSLTPSEWILLLAPVCRRAVESVLGNSSVASKKVRWVNGCRSNELKIDYDWVDRITRGAPLRDRQTHRGFDRQRAADSHK